MEPEWVPGMMMNAVLAMPGRSRLDLASQANQYAGHVGLESFQDQGAACACSVQMKLFVQLGAVSLLFVRQWD
jgi:hypothetical protein